MNKELIIIGYSGHAYVAIDIAKQLDYKIIGYVDKEMKAQNPFQYTYLGDETALHENVEVRDSSLFICIGANSIREKIYYELNNHFSFVTLKHMSSIVSDTVEISACTLIGAGAIINVFAKIGTGVIINTGAIIEHEVNVDDFAHICPGAVLTGNVSVGKRSFIGANAVVKQGVVIGDDVIIGAGAVILSDVPNGKIMVGNPGVVLAK